MNETSAMFEIIQSMLSQEGNRLTVTAACSFAGVSRSGYYAWKKAEPARQLREEQDRADFELILIAYQFRGYDKGAKGIHMRLLHMDPPVVMNVKKIYRLMKKYHLVCGIRKANPYRRMAKALRTSNVADNLLMREFEAYGPRIVLLTDITYIPYNGVFAYLSVILDAYTKEVLSYVLSPSLEVDFVLETVTILIDKHGTELRTETIVHSDQGCHYTSYRFIDILKDNDLRQSMSRKGNCWDNAPQESFFGHMKDSLDISSCESFEDVEYLIDDYMDYYNNDRYQWDLCKLAPKEFYGYAISGKYPLNTKYIPPLPGTLKPSRELGIKAATK